MTQISKQSRLRSLKEVLQDPERKSIGRMLFELANLTLTYKELPVHYFSRYLFKKSIKNVKDFVPNGLASKIAPALNNQTVKGVIDNKLYFDLFYRKFNISLPEIIMFNHKNKFVTGNTVNEIKCLNDFILLIAGLFDRDPSCDSVFIKKIYASSGGDNTYKLSADQAGRNTELMDEIYSRVISSEYLFQKTVKQHPKLDMLNPACLNTIRFDTFINKDGTVEIISGFIKLGLGNTHVDNTVYGGCGVGIDPETGRMKKNGWSKLRVAGVKVLEEHPLTKVKFENFQIPYFEAAKELVIKAAGLMPDLRLIGWDVGIGESGPVIIEGNSDYGINSNDMMYGGYMTNPVFRKVLHEINHQ